MTIVRPLVTIHTLNGRAFPLHEMNPEERFESHRIIHMRVMRWQVHPPDDEQAIYLQRDIKQVTPRQHCPRSVTFAANKSGVYSSIRAGAAEQLAAFPNCFPAIKPDHMHSQHTLGEEGEGFFTRLSAPPENDQAFITAKDFVTDAWSAESGEGDCTEETTQQVKL